MGKLINHYYAGGVNHDYSNMYFKIDNYASLPENQCVDDSNAIITATTGPDIYQVKEECKVTIRDNQYDYITNDAYKILIYKDFELTQFNTFFRVLLNFHWNGTAGSIPYDSNLLGGYFVPEDFDINNDDVNEYINSNDGAVIYINEDKSILGGFNGGSTWYGEEYFGLFYGYSNILNTYDNKYFNIIEESGTIEFGSMLSREYNSETEFMTEINGRSIGIRNYYLLGYYTSYEDVNFSKIALYDSYNRKIKTGELVTYFQISFNTADNITLTVVNSTNRNNSLTYNFTGQRTTINGLTTIVFECNMPQIIFNIM